MLIAFSGKIGAGKSFVSKEIATILNCPWVSFGDYVRQIASIQKLELNRLNLQNLGEALLRDDLRGFCSKVLEQAPAGTLNVVIDGVRHESVLHELQNLRPNEPLIHVHLIIDIDTRLERVTKRGELSDSTELEKIDQHSTEADVIDLFSKRANIVIDASSPIDLQVTKILECINSSAHKTQ